MALTTNNSLTPDQIVAALLGSGITPVPGSVTYIGDNVARGTFSGGLSDGLGIDSGVILSSGDIANAIGPNNNDGITTSNGTAGDPALDIIASGTTEDAAILQFDFIPTSASLSFKYVFASEEYNEFVNASFNDAFAFFLNGENIAFVPCTTIPITIKNVNNGSNASYYNNNDFGDLGPTTPFGTQFDGFTKVLTAKATVTPGTKYTLRLAIADTSDSALDSAVFLQAGSFSFGSPDLSTTISADSTTAIVGTPLSYTITVNIKSSVDAD